MILTVIAAFLTSLLNVLKKRSILYYAFLDRLEHYFNEKLGLRNGTLNLHYMDKDNMLVRRHILKDSSVFKRCVYMGLDPDKAEDPGLLLARKFRGKGKLYPTMYNRVLISSSKSKVNRGVYAAD